MCIRDSSYGGAHSQAGLRPPYPLAGGPRRAGSAGPPHPETTLRTDLPGQLAALPHDADDYRCGRVLFRKMRAIFVAAEDASATGETVWDGHRFTENNVFVFR